MLPEDKLKLARSYASRGWKVLLLHPEAKVPINLWRNGRRDGFEPLEHGHVDLRGFAASSDLALIEAWLSAYPDAGLGIDCRASGLFVLDLDQRPADGKDGRGALDTLAMFYGPGDDAENWGIPLRSRSPSGGEHWIYDATGLEDEPFAATNFGRKLLGCGLDIKWNGQIGVPSGDGRREWLNDVELVKPPGWLMDSIREIRQESAHPASKETSRGSREPRLSRVTAAVAADRMSLEDIQHCLTQLPVLKYNRHHDEWLQVMMATHSASGGCDKAREEFLQWCGGDPQYKYDLDSIADRWDSLDPDGKVTVGTLLYHVAEAGGTPPRPRGVDQFDAIPIASDYIDEYNSEIGCLMHGGKFRVALLSTDADGFPKVEFFRREDVANLYAPRTIDLPNKGRSQTFPLWIGSPRRRQFSDVSFDPVSWGCAPGSDGKLNLFLGWRYLPDPSGSYELFRQHWFSNICLGDEAVFQWQWAWVAQLVQQPAIRPGTAIVLRSDEQGTGKTLFGETIGQLLHPEHYVSISHERHLTGNFNRLLQSKLLIQAEEAAWAGSQTAFGVLRDMVTNKRMVIEPKGLDPFSVSNHSRLIFTSNKPWVVSAGLDERRFAVFEVSDGWKQNRERFGTMLNQLEAGGYAALFHDLLHADLAALPDPGVIPNTEALRDQKLLSLESVGQWWAGLLFAGGIGSDEWPEKCVIEELYRRYVAALPVRTYPVDRRHFGQRLRKLCPGLDRDREPAGNRAWFYRIPPLADCRAALERVIGGPPEGGWDR